MVHRAIAADRFISRRRVRELTATRTILPFSHLLLLLLVQVDNQAGFPIVHMLLIVALGRDLVATCKTHPDSPLVRPFPNAALGRVRIQRQSRHDVLPTAAILMVSRHLIGTNLHLIELQTHVLLLLHLIVSARVVPQVDQAMSDGERATLPLILKYLLLLILLMLGLLERKIAATTDHIISVVHI